MRIAAFIFSTLIVILLIIAFDTKLFLPSPLGKLLSPQHGIWQNAEPADMDFNAQLRFSSLKGNAEVYFDERLVPHVFASYNEDALFIQGYLHAKFRLWQMEFQTHAAAGRLTEILGAGANNSILTHDREMRRLGMVYAAEKSLREIEKDPLSKESCDAYTAGVNSYISNLKTSELPLEYKLLGYQPEPWTNLKIAIFLKYMSYDLAGSDDDFELTNAKHLFNKEVFDKMYPAMQDSLDPVVPRGTAFSPPAINLHFPAGADSLYADSKDSVTVREVKPERSNGSNNWAVNGNKTKSGYPILCNDPHLGTNLPAIWYEMQINTPQYNTYGVSFPGSPYIIIGFNDSCAWGVTNAGRDVRDYYEIQFKDRSKREYRFGNAWKKADMRVEKLIVRDRPTVYDTVAYTIFGPAMYDDTYAGSSKLISEKYYAVHWKANDPSNEVGAFARLAGVKNYGEYYNAIQYLHTPGQNFIFASKAGDIALWQQGRFPAKWKGQGEFVMPGTDSSFMWQGNIPPEENPHAINPERNYVSSGNQASADTSYPYFLGSKYPIYRGLIINRYLSRMQNISPDDMMEMQTDNYNVFAAMAKPLLLANVKRSRLDNDERKYLNILEKWNHRNDPREAGPTVFKIFWAKLENGVWADEFSKTTLPVLVPYESTLLEGLLKDSVFPFVDNINTSERESLQDIVTVAFRLAVDSLTKVEHAGRLEWARYKNTGARHLLRLPALSRYDLPIGGGLHCINAAKQFHGPSWRMVVHLTPKTEAYAVYPGGQSGNPGSKYYDTFVDSWAAGKYYTVFVMDKEDTKNAKLKWKQTFVKG